MKSIAFNKKLLDDYKGTPLDMMINNKNFKQEIINGEIIIGGNPKIIEYVIDYLRNKPDIPRFIVDDYDYYNYIE